MVMVRENKKGSLTDAFMQHLKPSKLKVMPSQKPAEPTSKKSIFRKAVKQK